jgi:hypothetical protein
MACISNTQKVDPKFVINPLNSSLKEKSIGSKAEVSPNMTKLGIHIHISRNGNAFNKRKFGAIRKMIVRAASQTRKSSVTLQFISPWLYPLKSCPKK